MTEEERQAKSDQLERLKKLQQLQQLKAQRASLQEQPVPEQPAPEAPPPAPEPPGLLKRSLETLRQGTSDAFSTMAGDSYGRSGDPTERDFQGTGYLPEARRLLQATGGDFLGGVADIGGDVISTGIQQLPQGGQDLIAKGVEGAGGIIADDPAFQLVGQGLEKWKESSPESYKTAGELANVGTALSPLKGYKPKFGDKAQTKLKNAVDDQRKLETQRLIMPDKYEGADLEISPGMLGVKKAKPREYLQSQIDEVADIPEVNPRGNYTENVNAIEAKVDDIRTRLDERISSAPDMDIDDVEYAIEQSIDRAAESPLLVGDAGTSANRIYDKFQKIIAEKTVDGKISPQSVLDSRIELDRWLKQQGGDVFGSGQSASKVATKEIRTTINQLVEKAAPDVGVSDDLRQMSTLLTARDTISPRSVSEARTGPGRYMEGLERRTGLSHPRTPYSATRNLSDVPAMALTGTMALGLGAADAAGGAVARNSAAVQKRLANAMRQATTTAEKAAILAAIKEEENN